MYCDNSSFQNLNYHYNGYYNSQMNRYRSSYNDFSNGTYASRLTMGYFTHIRNYDLRTIVGSYNPCYRRLHYSDLAEKAYVLYCRDPVKMMHILANHNWRYSQNRQPFSKIDENAKSYKYNVKQTKTTDSDSNNNKKDAPQEFKAHRGLKKPQNNIYFQKRQVYETVKVLIPCLLVQKGSPTEEKNKAMLCSFEVDFSGNYTLKTNEEVHVRFCKVDEDHQTCEDVCPYIKTIKINGTTLQKTPFGLSCEKYRKKARKESHLNITSYCKSQNDFKIILNGTIEAMEVYALRLEIVKALPIEEIVKKVPKNIKSFTEACIQQRFPDNPNDSVAVIGSQTFKVSLLCPLGKMRITKPAKSYSCTHVQCFDLEIFLQMNRIRNSWKCPVCDIAITFDKLVIDAMFDDILSQTNCNEIMFESDLTWKPVQHKTKKRRRTISFDESLICLNNTSIIDLTETDDEETSSARMAPPPKKTFR